MTIGGLARTTGVSVETIRYYQRLGLIGEPRRPPGGQRSYPGSIVDELAFVRRAQQLGFTLAEIKELQGFAARGDREGVRTIAETRYSRLVLHAKQLTVMSTQLRALLRKSRRYKGSGVDPIVAALRGANEAARSNRDDVGSHRLKRRA